MKQETVLMQKSLEETKQNKTKQNKTKQKYIENVNMQK